MNTSSITDNKSKYYQAYVDKDGNFVGFLKRSTINKLLKFKHKKFKPYGAVIKGNHKIMTQGDKHDK